MSAGNLAAADAPALADDERRWMEARLAEMGVPPGAAHAGAPAANGEAMIVLSTHAGESAVPPVAPTDGGAPVIAAQLLHVRRGETLVVRSPEGAPVRVVAGRLTVESGARVAIHTRAELHVAHVEGGDAPPIEFIGANGAAGAPGERGRNGTRNWRQGSRDAGPGGPGHPGEPGAEGPGGLIRFASVSGTVVVTAAGGNGGPGGPGGRGGDGARGSGVEEPDGNGGGGGPGGRGGDGGAGGTVVVAVGALQRASAIQLISRFAGAGAGGAPGDGGAPGGSEGQGGGKGGPGTAGSPGTELPVFSIRPTSSPDA